MQIAKAFLSVLILLTAVTTFAQPKTQTATKPKPADSLKNISLTGLNFRSVGPAITSGRIADIAVNPVNHSEYYVAAAAGGVWKTNNAGITFNPVFDGEGAFSIGCLAIDPTNTNVVWVGSGENNNQRVVAYGDGIYKSEDGGKSFKNMGLKVMPALFVFHTPPAAAAT